jgi:hypothetical protein
VRTSVRRRRPGTAGAGRVQEGPCLDSVWEQRTVRIEDMRTEQRWPRFAAEAVPLGVLSSLSFQLFVEGDDLGALNLYARAPHAFGEESEDVGLVLAAHAAVALAGPGARTTCAARWTTAT